MDSFTALMRSDEVRTFPSLEMPAPKVRNNPGRSRKTDTSEKVLFPGLLKTKKSSINKERFRSGEDSTIFTGFNSMNLKFDVATENINTAYKHVQQNSSREKIIKLPTESTDPFQVTANQLLSPKGPPPSVTKQDHDKSNATLDELRNYMTMLDKHSLHNFMIYDGKTLKDTPEFQSFRRMYQHKWGSITTIIDQIESFLSKYQVKLAIINGPKVFELSKLNLPTIKKEDIYPCLANLEQLSVYFEGDGGAVSNDSVKAAVKIQSLGRGYISRKRIKRMKLLIRSAVRIQSVGRLIIQRALLHSKMQNFVSDAESKWLQNRSMLNHWWSVAVDTASVDSGAKDPMKSRTLIFLPSLSIAEYLRLSIENFSALQNVFITGLYQLVDPAVTLIYVCPKHLSSNEIIYHEKLLSLMGISLLPKRLHFITPEMTEKLPDHIPLSLALLCSSVALNKIKYIIKRSRSMSMIIPTTVSWIEKRLAHALNVPVLSADPSISETLSSRSYAKKVFEESEVVVPIGAHDIFNVDDLLMALSKLMASSINIRRWIIKLNYDYNNESCVILDADRLSIVHALRKEQSEMGDGAGWFSRQVQLSVRKRLLAYLTIDLSRRVKICRKDIYRDWDYYLRMMKQYGAVLEAEPIEAIGFVHGLCFIDPSGNVDLSTGVEVYVDAYYQKQGYHFPQRMTPDLALQGATRAVARTLFGKYGLIGYITVKFQSYWDALDKTPRLWGLGLQFGMSEVFGAIGTVSVMNSSQSQPQQTQRQDSVSKLSLPFSLIASLPEGRFVTYIPFSVHYPLRSSTDESFFKLSRMRGIAFDLPNNSGTIFFVVDSIVGGAVSLLCVGKTRKKAAMQAINALSFISQQFGKDHDNDPSSWNNLTKILVNMKKIIRFDKNN